MPDSFRTTAAQRADWTIDQNWAHYSAAEHAVWKTLFERQSRLLPGRACDAFMAGLRQLPLDAEQIPDFRALNEVLLAQTGWQLVAVPGLLPDAVFFAHLAQRRFPAGQFIRPAHQLDYLQEPDIFHDVFGHLPMLMQPVLADFIQAYGVGGLRAQASGMLAPLARVYWYTVEFGLVQQAQGLRLYGAGLASSYTESQFALADSSPQHLRFALDRVLRTDYRIDDFQETYFVIDALDDLLALAQIDFAPLYQQLRGQALLAPGAAAAGDQCLQRGSASYHRARR